MSPKQCLLLAIGLLLLFSAVVILPFPTRAQRDNQPETDQDNIYHEDENLPDDADVFPRIGWTLGSEQEVNNCRATAWGPVVRTIPGNVFVEINSRSVDRQGDSWFQVAELHCWLHESRVDLL